MAELFDMGKYALFIWPSYGLSVFVLIGLVAWNLRARKLTKALHGRLESQLQSGSKK